MASYVDDTYNDYDTPPRGDPVSHFATQLPPSVVRSLTQIGNIKSVAFDNRSAISDGVLIYLSPRHQFVTSTPCDSSIQGHVLNR